MNKKSVHFMGIGGSGIAGVALLAKENGFQVSGCDLSTDNYYQKTLQDSGIKITIGHDEKHLNDVDILAVSAAILKVNPNLPEVTKANDRGILMGWQQFLADYLQKDKFVITVSGSHGKTTTTALLGLALEKANQDPSVEVGGIVKEWGRTTRFGNSKYFICEGDEYNYNFLAFSPSLLIINNIEMDHPEFFQSFDIFLGAFERLIKKMIGPKIIIVNEDDNGVKILLNKMKNYLTQNQYQIIGYRLGEGIDFPFENRYLGKIIELAEEKTEFSIELEKGPNQKNAITEQFTIKIPGTHNVLNSLAVVTCCLTLQSDIALVRKALFSFNGVGRRIELVSQAGGIKLFDDYAHHPTAVKATLKALRQKFPNSKLIVIFEPHQFSRLKLFLKDFAANLKLADQIIVTRVFEGREEPIDGYDGAALVTEVASSRAEYIENFDSIAEKIIKEKEKGEVVVVLGAGKSYKITQKIKELLEK